MSGTGKEPPDVKRKVKDGRPFIYTPLAGAGTNEGEEYYQKCLAEYCRDVGVPSSMEATFLHSRRQRHRERPLGSKVRRKPDLGSFANFIDVYQRNHQDRAMDLRHVPRPAVARSKTSANSQLKDKFDGRKHMTDRASDKYTDVFLQQAREAILQETQAVEAKRAARARQLAMNPPRIYKRDWSSCKPFPHSEQFAGVEGDADIAQELAWGRGTGCKVQQIGVLRKAAGDGLFSVGSTTAHAPKELKQGTLLQPLPTEPPVADAAARFRVTSDMASSLAVDSQSRGKLVVNSVGDILRHEKLRRLKKVVRMAFLREAGPAAIEFTANATLRDARRTIPRALLDRETENAGYTFGLTEDQQVEVAMVMDAADVDFQFLQRCGHTTEVRLINTRAHQKTSLPSRASIERLLAHRPCSKGISHMRSGELGGVQGK
eukprot:g19794.t1